MIEASMFSGDESRMVYRILKMSAIGAKRTLVSLLVADSERVTSLELALRLVAEVAKSVNT
jgi:hypothetical protein